MSNAALQTAIKKAINPRRLEQFGPPEKRRRISRGWDKPCRFDFDYARFRPVDDLHFQIAPITKCGRKFDGFRLEIDFFSQRGGWTGGSLEEVEQWEDEKTVADAPPTRAGYRALYRLARGLLKGRPMCDGETTWLPLHYYQPAAEAQPANG